jgi:hypothetical protein
MKLTALSLIALLPLAASSASAHPVGQTVEAVLRANHEEMATFRDRAARLCRPQGVVQVEYRHARG